MSVSIKVLGIIFLGLNFYCFHNFRLNYSSIFNCRKKWTKKLVNFFNKTANYIANNIKFEKAQHKNSL